MLKYHDSSKKKIDRQGYIHSKTIVYLRSQLWKNAGLPYYACRNASMTSIYLGKRVADLGCTDIDSMYKEQTWWCLWFKFMNWLSLRLESDVDQSTVTGGYGVFGEQNSMRQSRISTKNQLL